MTCDLVASTSHALISSLDVEVSEPTAVRFTLIRLGSTTHGFDQAGQLYTVQGPPDDVQAPPGHYMLFAISSDGQPSVGVYVRVGAEP